MRLKTRRGFTLIELLVV
ncbi:MAG: prepilin-type N-terminal cleavage/methylation domain-containing protein, partial [bacterium]